MTLAEYKKFKAEKELTMKKLVAEHNHNLALSGVGVMSYNVDWKSDLITVVPECYRNK